MVVQALPVLEATFDLEHPDVRKEAKIQADHKTIEGYGYFASAEEARWL